MALLCLDLTNGTQAITGQVSGAEWTAQLLGYRFPAFGKTNPAPYAGRYTMAISGGVDPSVPLGYGVAAIAVAAGLGGGLKSGISDFACAPVCARA